MPPPQGKGRRNKGPREPREFEEYMLQLDRVTRVVKGGRRMRFRATVVIGDKAGRVALGLGKGNDVQIAMRKAVAEAKKDIITVPIINGTITHDVRLKYKAARILAMPAADGTGVIAGGAMRKIFELAGVKNVMGKSFGTNNRVVVAQATLNLLMELRMTEASKKYVAELRKERDAAVKKEAAEAEKNRPPRRGKGGPRRDDGDRGDMKKADMAVAVAKAEKAEGRLEKELKEGK